MISSLLFLGKDGSTLLRKNYLNENHTNEVKKFVENIETYTVTIRPLMRKESKGEGSQHKRPIFYLPGCQ